jgi:hypothetical protein
MPDQPLSAGRKSDAMVGRVLVALAKALIPEGLAGPA